MTKMLKLNYTLSCLYLILTVAMFQIVFGSFFKLSVEASRVFHKPCDTSQSFFVVYGQSFEKCTQYCQHQSNCEVLMFSNRMKQCALFDASIKNKTYVQSYSICLYMRVDKISGNRGLSQDIQCSSLEKFDISKKRCVKSRCSGPTHVKHSAMLFTSTTIGMSARYKCKPGYFGSGNPQIVCQPNTTWSKITFICTPNSCPKPIAVENAVLLESAPTKVGSVVRYKCNKGFHLSGEPKILCQLNATWATPNFFCIDRNCPPALDITGAILSSPNRSIGAMAYYDCKQGYLASGDPNIRCLENSTWTKTNFTCEKLCSSPEAVENAHLQAVEYVGNGSLFTVGTQLNYSCNKDFHGECEKTTNICVSGGIWKPYRVLCCPNGTISFGDKCYKAYPTYKEMNYFDIDGTCSSVGFKFVSTSRSLFSVLVNKGENPAPMMLYKKRKTDLQTDLYKRCLSIHLNTTELVDYKNATYEDTMKVIKYNDWDKISHAYTVNFCNRYLINDWLPGEPSGGEAEQCIVLGPNTNFKYTDIDCNILNQGLVGFVCMYFPPYV